jgi:hypothetical protein
MVCIQGIKKAWSYLGLYSELKRKFGSVIQQSLMKFVSVSALIYDIMDDVLTTDSDDTNYIISCHWVNYRIFVHWENMVFHCNLCNKAYY